MDFNYNASLGFILSLRDDVGHEIHIKFSINWYPWFVKTNNIICHWVCNGSGGDVFLVVAVDIGLGLFFFFFLVEGILMGCILKIKYEMLSIL